MRTIPFVSRYLTGSMTTASCPTKRLAPAGAATESSCSLRAKRWRMARNTTEIPTNVTSWIGTPTPRNASTAAAAAPTANGSRKNPAVRSSPTASTTATPIQIHLHCSASTSVPFGARIATAANAMPSSPIVSQIQIALDPLLSSFGGGGVAGCRYAVAHSSAKAARSGPTTWSIDCPAAEASLRWSFNSLRISAAVAAGTPVSRQ